MTLPTTFGPLTGPIPLTDLDLNFAAVGALTIIGCGVTGTNAISMAPHTNAPVVSAYANYMVFSGIAAADNTGAVTAGIGSLSSLPVYKDSPTGPVLLTGGEIQQGNLFTLTYDSALTAGGGWHVQTGINSSAGTFLSLGGGTLTGPLIGTALTLSGNASVAGLTSNGALNGVSIAAVQANFSGTLTGATVTIGPPGSPIKNVASVSVASVVYASIPPNMSADQSIAFPVLNLNDTVMMGLPSLTSVGVSFNAFASTSGTATLRAFNTTASTVTGLTLAGVRLTTMQF